MEIQDAASILGEELSLPPAKVGAVLALLAEGNTVPFISRYRKEVTGGMDEVQIRSVEERHAYLRELEDRRQTVLKSIDEQGKLTDELRRQIQACSSKSEIEDLYLPYKPKRRTRAMIAREKGLEPLANLILEQSATGTPESEAAAFVSEEKGVADVAAALAGARDIVAEHAAENATVRAFVRKRWSEDGVMGSEAIPEATQEPTKFEQYYDFHELLSTIPSHRYLALRRGEKEGVLRVRINVDEERVIPGIEQRMEIQPNSPFAEEMSNAIRDSYKRLLAPSIETDLRVDLKMKSDREAVEVFATNLEDLLLFSPLGEKGVLGIDPGQRTGCKCAVVDATGKFLGHTTIYLLKNQAEAAAQLKKLIEHFQPSAIGVGNGTGGRETEAFVKKVLRETGVKNTVVVTVNEAGASIYSASEIAREEFPDLDLTIRGAISIARRLQDPLAELVKIDPQSIGVGQYQHDVHQPLLQRKLDDVVESCVNRVGVEINTSSAALLSRVAGIGPTLAKKIIAHRESNGAFRNRKGLLKVPSLGPRTFQQCAGFLRIRGGDQPLDASAVHPERYDLVATMARQLDVDVQSLIGNDSLVNRIEIKNYVNDEVGEPTLRDIIDELKKPGRDPRDTFEPPKFRDDVNEIGDLQPDMVLEGVVTNVTAFGAFVDIGVHQDGLVHVSQLADKFVNDPREVVKVGDKLTVRVLEVDLPRQRIALSARRDGGGARESRGRAPAQSRSNQRRGRDSKPPRRSSNPPPKQKTEGRNNPLGDLLKGFLDENPGS